MTRQTGPAGRQARALSEGSACDAPRDYRSAKKAHDLGWLPAQDHALSSCTTTTIFPPTHYDFHSHIPSSRFRSVRKHVVGLRPIEAGHRPRDLRHGVREQDTLVGGYRTLL